MRDDLPRVPRKEESMIINQDSLKNRGTHWTCFVKQDKHVYYFDSFGKLVPPRELIEYLGSDCKIFYNSEQFQSFDTVICGHLCLRFLYEFYNDN